MKKFIVFCVAVAALYYFKPELFSFGNRGLFDANGKPAVAIVTVNGCGASCSDAVSLLKEKKVLFEEVDVSDNNEAGMKRFSKLGAGSTLPVIFIGKQRIEGFNRTLLTAALSNAYGLSMLDSNMRRIVKTHFNPDGTPMLVMYGASWCPYCKSARETLRAKGIAYTYLEVDTDSVIKADYDQLEASGFPLIYVGARRFGNFEGNKSEIFKALKAGA